MHSHTYNVCVLGLIGMLCLGTATSIRGGTDPGAADLRGYRGVPRGFVENRGQVGDPVRFIRSCGGSTLYVLDDALLWHFVQATPATTDGPTNEQRVGELRSLGITFEGANTTARSRGQDATKAGVSYFRGDDPARWITAAPTYAKVATPDLYDGISLEAYVRANDSFEYDLLLEPHANPDEAVLRVDGAESLSIDGDGSLVFNLGGGLAFRHMAPTAYQHGTEGELQKVPCRYRLVDESRVAFALGPYDRSRQLVIDPQTPAPVTMFFFTYFGGSENDHATDLAVRNGKVYVLGATTSQDLPVTPGAFSGPSMINLNRDLFVAKFDVNGTLLYCTYLGSIAYDELPHGIDVDRTGAVYIAATVGAAYPVTSGAFDTIYGGNHDGGVTKLDPSGSNLVYSTYLGGELADYCFGIAVDSLGQAVVCGSTSSFLPKLLNSYYPITTGVGVVEPAVGGPLASILVAAPCVTKLSLNGSTLIWSTFVAAQTTPTGEPNFSASANDIKLDDEDRPTMVGQTTYRFALTGSPNTFSSFYSAGTLDAFVAQLQADATSYRYLTHFGGGASDQGLAIACDPAGTIVVTGRTRSSPSTFPLANAFDSNLVGHDAFVARFDPTKTGTASLDLSSYLGGAGDDIGTGITVDSSGRLYVCGFTSSANEPLFQVNGLLGFQGVWDGFVTKVAGQSVTFSTYLGGSGADTAQDIEVDSGGLYLIGQTAAINPTNPTNDLYTLIDNLDPNSTLPGFDTTFNGGSANASQAGGSGNYVQNNSQIPIDTTPFLLHTDAFLIKMDRP